jgi:Ca2+-dependent lipid-binding protein
MTNFPHVKTVEISFIEKPTFDYVLKPIGGETLGFDINNIPGLAPFIRDQVHANLGPMMYDPNVFTIDLQALLSGNPLDSAIGVLKVYIRGARSLKAVKIGGGAPDPYVSFALGSKPSIGKTKTINSTSNPSFQETHFILINSLADLLSFSVFDYNEHRPDNLLGTVTQELAPLADDAEQEGIVSRVIHGGKDRGELRYDLSYFPVLQPTKNADGTIEPPPESQTGIVRFFIHQGKDLDIARQHGDLNPFVKMYLGGSKTEVHRTQVMKHAPQPIWESHTEFLVPEKNNSVITLQVINGKDFAPDPRLGNLTVKLSDLLEAGERQQDWFPLQNSRAGKIRLSAIWKPVAMTGALDGASTYTPPIGIMRVHLKKAVDVKNVEAALGGKSDPYVRVIGANKTLARTEVIQNNLNPEWDQIVYVPVHHLKISYILELMDYQNIGKDRSLGFVDLKLSDYIEETGDQAYPYRSKGPQTLAEKIRLDKANHYKGTLHFEMDFKPAMSLRGGVSFEAKKNELEIAAEEQDDSDTSSLSSSDEEKIGHHVNHAKKQGNAAIAPATPQKHARKLSEQFSMPPSNGNGHKVMPSMDKASIAPSTINETTDAEKPERGVVMSQEDLLSHRMSPFPHQEKEQKLSCRIRYTSIPSNIRSTSSKRFTRSNV